MLVRSQYHDSLRALKGQQSNFSEWLWAGGNAANSSETPLNFTLVSFVTASLEWLVILKDVAQPSRRPTSRAQYLRTQQ
jgi:hypothetical protein